MNFQFVALEQSLIAIAPRIKDAEMRTSESVVCIEGYEKELKEEEWIVEDECDKIMQLDW